MKLKKYFLNPHFFLKFFEEKLILWDYKNHCQYILKDEYLDKLKEIATGIEIEFSPIVQELLELNIISEIRPKPTLWKWDVLSHIYHLGVQDLSIPPTESTDEWIKEYIEFCKGLEVTAETLIVALEGETIDLPQPDPERHLNTSLWDTFKHRKTSRNFKGEPISLNVLSTILFSSFGLIHGNWSEEEKGVVGHRKSSPSGGALHPVETYLVVFNVEGLSPGIYHYSVGSHQLVKRGGPLSSKELVDLLCGQFFAEGISVGIFLVAHFEKAWSKYKHSRSYRDIYLEAGHASQNFLLTATACQLQTWMKAWFNDTQVSQKLNLVEEIQVPMLFLGIGTGNSRDIPLKISEALTNIS
jgi:SagB-type dehydrogenase family enzyme